MVEVASYVVGDRGVFYTIDVFGACFGGENAQDSGAAADVEDDFTIEERGGVEDGIFVGVGSGLKVRRDGEVYSVLEHLFVDREMGVGVEIIVGIVFEGVLAFDFEVGHAVFDVETLFGGFVDLDFPGLGLLAGGLLLLVNYFHVIYLLFELDFNKQPP
jgi:hypothetical protein